jgi:16S rRNA (guanine1207-N2)-methyltransferase
MTRRWYVGGPAPGAGPGLAATDGRVALTFADAMNAPSVWFHEAMEGAASARDGAVVRIPEFRGKSLVTALAWLVSARLVHPGAEVSWLLAKGQGPDSVRRLLAAAGWTLERAREGGLVRLRGAAPPPGPPPRPATFTTSVGGQQLELAADWGVFSPGHVDEGTRLLLDVALAGPPVEAVADVGIGYGPLAVGLVHAGLAARAVGTDVDSVALWLAARNAAAYGVDLAVSCTPDPGAVEPTPLTVCNVPTHVDAAATAALLRGLLGRARGARLLMVVHASLEERYARYVSAAGLRWSRHPGPAHVVLDVAG